MFDHDQVVGGKAQLPGRCHETLECCVIELRCPGEDPQIRSVGPGDQRVLVTVLVQFDYVVSAVKRSEERYFQLTHIFVSNEVGLAFGLVPFLLFCVVTAVDDLDAAVIAKTVVCRDVGEATLETVVEAGDLVPGTEIAVQIEPGNDFHAFGRAGAGRQ